MTDQTTYLATDAYAAMLDQLEQIARSFDPAAPDDLRTRLVEAMGDAAGIWPASIANGSTS